MDGMSSNVIILIGCIGGLIPDMLRIIKGRHEANLPKYLGYANFWVGLVLLVFIGGLAAWLAEATEVKQALAYGYAAPELISRIFSKTNEHVNNGDGKDNVRSIEPDPAPTQPGQSQESSGSFQLLEWWAK